MPVDKDKVKFYLDYLDKEMTIMGILSSFCIVALGFAIEKLIFNDTISIFHDYGNEINLFCMLGFLALLLAAICFYRQRALLAFYYGQISYSVSDDDEQKVKQYQHEVCGWDKWLPYEGAFSSLYLAFCELGCMLLQNKEFIKSVQCVLAWIFVVLFFIRYALARRAYKRFPQNDEPIVTAYPLLKKVL